MRSDQNTAKIPSKTFSAFLPIIRQDLIDADLRGGTYQLVARTICDFIDLNKKVEIGDDTYHEGWTRWVSYNEIADAADIARRTVIYAINAMIEAKVLEKDQLAPRTRNKFRFAAYDKLHAEIEANPSIVQETHAYRFDPTSTSEPDALNDAEDAHSLELKEFKGPHPTGSSTSTGLEAPEPIEEGGDLNSQKQENAGGLFLPEKPAPAPEPVEKQKNSQKKQDADSSLSENSSSPETQPASQQPKQAQPFQNPDLKKSPPPAVPSDVVPNGYLASTIDRLAEKTRMNAAQTDESIEDFARLFKPDAVVVSELYIEPAQRLKEKLISALDAASLEMPPLLFLKHCLKHTEHLVAEGKLDTQPTSPNFFLTGRTGPGAIDYCINKLSGENRAHTDKERTDKLLSELKSKRGTPMPPELRTEFFGK